jgi:hypothetical protein
MNAGMSRAEARALAGQVGAATPHNVSVKAEEPF